MELILKGIATGFLLSIMVGPVFFVLLETSIRRGVKAAVALDVGVLVSDIIYVIIAFVFYQQVKDLSEGDDNSLLRLIGGVLFIIYGVYTFFKKVKEAKLKEDIVTTTSAAGYIILGMKGLILNLMNPLVVFYWFSVMTVGADDSGSSTNMVLYLTYILVTFFSIDFLKILGAKKLRPLVTPRVLVGLNRLVGIVFAAFGLVLIAQGIIGLVTK